jgi:uncharacterized protein YciI
MTGKKMTNEHKDFLNALRDSGVINMFGAGAYLQREFGISRQKAKTILLEWMKSFNDR